MSAIARGRCRDAFAALLLNAGASDGADTGGANSKLSSMPEQGAIADDLYPARVGHGDGAVAVGHRWRDVCGLSLMSSGTLSSREKVRGKK